MGVAGIGDLPCRPGDGVRQGRPLGVPCRRRALAAVLVWVGVLGAGRLGGGVLINELHYHPASGIHDEEFIELYNPDGAAVDLAGWSFSAGVSFVFPDGARIEAGGYAVVARSRATLESIHGPLAVLYGDYTGRLDNAGERLGLADAAGMLVDEVEYGDDWPWPTAPDGAGPSLELRHPSLESALPSSWSESLYPDGTPGRVNSAWSLPGAGLVLNEVARTEGADGWVELYNPTAAAIAPAGLYLGFAPGELAGVRLDDIPPVAPGAFLLVGDGLLAGRLSAAGGTVWLVGPDGVTILDRLAYPRLSPGASAGRYPDAASRVFVFGDPTPGGPNRIPAAASIAINEINYHPPFGRGAEEFIELYNHGSEPVSLAGWRFTDGVSFTFPDESELGAGAYLLVVQSAGGAAAAYGAVPVAGEYAGQLGNDGETLRLVDRYDRTICAITYGDEGDWPADADGEGGSLELLRPDLTPDVPGFWRAAAAGTAAWSLVELGPLIASGGMELYLTLEGAGDALVDGFQLVDGGGRDRAINGDMESDDPAWTAIGNHEASEVVAAGAWSGARCLHLRAAGAGDARGNHVVVPLPGFTASALTVRLQARWLRGSPTLQVWTNGKGCFYAPPRLPPLAWANLPTAPSGTPGRANSRYSAAVAPAVSGIAHAPAVPPPQTDAVVRARVAAADGEQPELALLWRLREATAVTTGLMNDAGVAPDALAADGIYSGLIPGQAAGQVVEFWVLAEGAGGGLRTLEPAPFPDRSNLVRFAAPEADAGLPRVHILMSELSAARLAARGIYHDGLLDATVTCGDELFYHAGVRYRGNTTRAGTPKPYRVDLGKHRTLLGLSELNLNAYRPLAQVLNYDLHRRAGAPAPAARSVWLAVNGEKARHYALVQPVDDDLLEELYPADAPPAPLYRGDNRPARQNRWEEVSVAELADPVAIQQAIHYYAIQAVTAAYDSYWFGNNTDIYLYHRPAESVFHLLVWDTDMSFRMAECPVFPNSASRTTLIRYAHRYCAQIVDLMDGLFSVETMARRIEDLYGGTTVDTSAEAAFIADRHAYLAERLTLAVTEATEQTTIPLAVLRGRAPQYWTHRITVNGAAEEIQFAYGGEEWSARVSLPGPGRQPVLVEAWDEEGNAFQSLSLTVELAGDADDDGDRMPDWWEWLHGFPWQAGVPETADSPPGADPDADGLTNLLESAYGGDPRAADMRPVIVRLTPLPAEGATVLEWSARAGMRYQVWCRDLAAAGEPREWRPLGPAQAVDVGGLAAFRDEWTQLPDGPSGTAPPVGRLYRVEAVGGGR